MELPNLNKMKGLTKLSQDPAVSESDMENIIWEMEKAARQGRSSTSIDPPYRLRSQFHRQWFRNLATLLKNQNFSADHRFQDDDHEFLVSW